MFNKVEQFTFNNVEKVVCVWQTLFELIKTASFSTTFVYVYLKRKARHNIKTKKRYSPGSPIWCLIHLFTACANRIIPFRNNLKFAYFGLKRHYLCSLDWRGRLKINDFKSLLVQSYIESTNAGLLYEKR